MKSFIKEPLHCPCPEYLPCGNPYYIKEISQEGEEYFCFLPYNISGQHVLISEKLYTYIKRIWEKGHQTILVIYSATTRHDGVLVPDTNGLSLGESIIE
jgi:hypothetical protein